MSPPTNSTFHEIKHPQAFLSTDDGDSREVFWADGDMILCWSDCPKNFPRWGFMQLTKREAIDAITKLIADGWDLIESDPAFFPQ